MKRQIKNLVFEGGGILGIAYLGVLDYMYQNGQMKEVERIAGTSAGAITACIASLNLTFEEIDKISYSLDYKKIPEKNEFDELSFIPKELKEIMEGLFGDINCIYRLIHQYGWYSTEYFYSWINRVIAEQFDRSKKLPPYTFSDFKNPYIHKNNRSFLDLYIIGTNLSMKKSKLFSFETTPNMEVAQAVRISMSIPLLFEAVKTEDVNKSGNVAQHVYCDGGAMNNYPLTIFDTTKFNSKLLYGKNMETVGVRFLSRLKYSQIENLLEYIESLLQLSSYIQQESYDSSPLNKERSIVINANGINPIDFNINRGDERYQFLYAQGYHAAKEFFE